MLSVGEGKGETEASPKWRVGVHTSIAGSVEQAAERAHQIGCTSFQIFSSSPRMWRARDFSAAELASFARVLATHDLSPVVIHTNYLVNLASPDAVLRRKSLEAFVGEIRRAEALEAKYLVLHPGSCRDGSKEQGIRDLAASVREAARMGGLDRATILIENMCGQGNVLCGNFEELRDVLALLDGVKVACCIDTAHCYAAGMDISTEQGLTAMLAALDRTIELGRVPVIHTNDSRSALGSHRDRHEHIGQGGIGLEGFRRIVNHPSLREKVFILETPIEEDGDDRRNMQAIRSVREANELHANLAAATGERTALAPKVKSKSTIPTTRSGTFPSPDVTRNARL